MHKLVEKDGLVLEFSKESCVITDKNIISRIKQIELVKFGVCDIYTFKKFIMKEFLENIKITEVNWKNLNDGSITIKDTVFICTNNDEYNDCDCACSSRCAFAKNRSSIEKINFVETIKLY